MQTENPFKGPSSYEDGDKFYGREIEIKELSALIKNDLLTLLFSRSGTGKSSLLKAGLFSSLKIEFEFFPVYIHLNEVAVKASSAHTLCDFVIKRCEEEIRKQFNNKENFKHNLKEVRSSDSLFEFIYNTQIIEIDKTSSAEYVIKPLLIFDQFEEIFSNPINKKELQFLLREIRCLVQNEVPEYLREAVMSSHNEEHHKIKNALKDKQKNFRILFSFREEYLPQFESLKREIPSIRFTNSRYRLEPFTVDTATDIIVKTAPRIPDDIARTVAENIAIDVEGFDEKRVDPFLMSLICQIIYADLLGIKPTGEVEKTKIKSLVDNALNSYVNKIYNEIDDETKKFIEERLITSDGKKNSVNYNEVENKPRLNSDILKLVENPDFRLLSIGQFLDSKHISILHDRLLPPLIQRKEKRKNDDEAAALLAKQQELENKRAELIKKSRRNKRRLITYFLLGSLVLGYWLFANNEKRIKNNNRAMELKELRDSANLLQIRADSSKRQADDERRHADTLSKAAYKSDSQAREMSKLALLNVELAKDEKRKADLAKKELRLTMLKAEYYKGLVDRINLTEDLKVNKIDVKNLGDSILFSRIFDELLELKRIEKEDDYYDLIESIKTAIAKKNEILEDGDSFDGYLKAKEIWEDDMGTTPFLDSILLYGFFNKTIFYKQIIPLDENLIYSFDESKTILSFLNSNGKSDSKHFIFNGSNNIFSGSFDIESDTLKISAEPKLIFNDTASINSLSFVDNKKIIGLLDNSLFAFNPGENKPEFENIPGVQIKSSRRNKNNIAGNVPGILSPNGKYLITYTEKDSVILWKLDGLRPVEKRVLNIKPDNIKSTIFSNNSKKERVLLLGSNAFLRVYNVDSTQNLISSKSSVRAANFTPDGNQLITLSRNGIYLKDLSANAREVLKFEIPDDIIKNTDQINSISLSPDSRRLLIETDEDIIVINQHLNKGSSLITPSLKSSSDLTYQKFQNNYSNSKVASFLDANSIITVDEEGYVYLCRIYPEFNTLEEAFRKIETPSLTEMTILKQFEKYPTESTFKQILDANDVDLITEAAQISYDRYIDAISPDTVDLIRAIKLYEKAIQLPDADSGDIAGNLININRERITNPAISCQDFQNNTTYYKEIINITGKYNFIQSRLQLSTDYGNLSWYSFFTKEFEDALKYAIKGNDIDSTNDFIYTNLALGYLFNGKFLKAEQVYKDHKDGSYRSSGRKFSDAFKEDFERLEHCGIINKKDSLIYAEVERIKTEILKLPKTQNSP